MFMVIYETSSGKKFLILPRRAGSATLVHCIFPYNGDCFVVGYGSYKMLFPNLIYVLLLCLAAVWFPRLFARFMLGNGR